MPLPDLSRFNQLLGDSANRDDSTNEALNYVNVAKDLLRVKSPSTSSWAIPRSRDDSSNKALNIQCQDMSAAGRTTVFFA